LTARRANAELLRQERAQGLVRLAARPVELQIEATNRCYGRCPTCARHFYDRAANPPGELSPDVLEAIAPLFATAERVLVGGYGEPLLSAMTDEIVARANAAGCHTSIITAAADLSDRRVARLAAAGLDEILLSVDGADETSMKRWRGVSLRGVLAGLNRLRTVRPEIAAAFNVTVHVSNLDELPAIVRLAAANDVARVAVFHQKLYSRTQAGSSVLAIFEHASEVFAAANEAAANAGIDLELPPLSGARPCKQPFRMLVVRHDGLVQGCCSALFESHLPRVVLGRLPGDDPLELWNAPAMQAARAATLGDKADDSPCTECGFSVFSIAAHERFLDEVGDET
jgi:MoaA/NifB/PqqE/SkfB family radical SAM enzyme